MLHKINHGHGQRGNQQGPRLAVAFALLSLFGVGIASPWALLTVSLDGLAAAIVVGPAILFGMCLVPLFRLGPLPLRWHLLLGAALGLGGTSLLVLLLGLGGVLDRRVWLVLLLALAVAGVLRLRTLLNPESDAHEIERREGDILPGNWRLLWLVVLPFLGLALLAASNAPGFIWAEEGFGYDVLEYHLQMPKEYFLAGQIQYAPHNVYANFPANVEMLYLLAMVLLDDIYDVGTVANAIHLSFAVLTVLAAWVTGREWSERSGVVCGVVMGSAGWLCYLAGLAYVENGLLFYGLVATAILLRACRADKGECSAGSRRGWFLLAGVVAGFACGCKYTAVPLIALPLVAVTILARSCSLRARIGGASLFALGILLAFSPWLGKNLTMTGNPVFPLMNEVFQGSPPGWGEDETSHWEAGHTASAAEQTATGRLRAVWVRLLGDRYQRIGPIAFLLAGVGLFCRRRDRIDLALIAMVGLQLVIWIMFTHLYARFAVVLLIPLVLLCGRSVLGSGGRWRGWLIAGAVVAGGAWNFSYAASLHLRESPRAAPASLIYDGRLSGYEYFAAVNQDLAPDAKLLLIGDAKAFYFQRDVVYFTAFNRNPFLELIADDGLVDGAVAWLRGEGFTHLLVNWAEVDRLSRTYGFSPDVSRKELEERFQRLAVGGLTLIRKFPHPQAKDSSGRYVELYTVSPSR